jgi:thiol-disulfide isomerase/thioredoxin
MHRRFAHALRAAWFAFALLGSCVPAFAARVPVQAPAFSLPGQHGIVALDSLRGKVVLVDFWASWCVPCHRSFPWMSGLHERYKDKGLVIVAIDLDKSRDAAEQFLAQHPAPFRVAFDPAGTTAEAYHVSGMPSTYLVAPNGEIRYSHIGFDSKKTAELEALVQESCRP